MNELVEQDLNITQSDAPSVYIMEVVPAEIWYLLLSCLINKEDLIAAALVCKLFYEISNYLFQKELELHFPHVFARFKGREGINWYLLLQETNGYEYRNLSASTINLFKQVKAGNTENAKKNLQLKELFTKDANGFTILDWAKNKNREKFLDDSYQLAVQINFTTHKGIDVKKLDEERRTVLDWAILSRRPPFIILQLIKEGADVNGISLIDTSPLEYAVLNRNIEIIKILLANGANINATSTLGTPLLIAIKKGDLEIFNFLLAQGARTDLPYGAWALLYHAAAVGQSEMIKTLLKGSPHNIQEVTPHFAVTALLIAAERGYGNMVELLLLAGVNVNSIYMPGQGGTAIFVAAQNGRIDVVEVLLQWQCDLTITFNSNPDKLREWANKYDDDMQKRMDIFITSKLQEEKSIADTLEKNVIKITPLEIAKIRNHEAIILLLEKATHAREEWESNNQALQENNSSFSSTRTMVSTFFQRVIYQQTTYDMRANHITHETLESEENLEIKANNNLPS